MLTGLIILHVVICVLLTVVVLLQFGKGAEAGAMMGGGASQAVFTSSAKGNFFTKMTTFLAIAFMVNSIILTVIKSQDHQKSLFDGETPVAAPLSNELNTEAPTQTTPVTEDAVEAKTKALTTPAETKSDSEK